MDHTNPQPSDSGRYSAKDPCGANPFSAPDQRHTEWDTATRTAERALIEHTRAYLARNSPEHLKGARWNVVDDVRHSATDFQVGVFDIWAERGLAVVHDSMSALDYSDWVGRYSQETLAMLISSASCDPDVDLPAYAAHVRYRFADRVIHWTQKANEHAIQEAENQRGCAYCIFPLTI